MNGRDACESQLLIAGIVICLVLMYHFGCCYILHMLHPGTISLTLALARCLSTTATAVFFLYLNGGPDPRSTEASHWASWALDQAHDLLPARWQVFLNYWTIILTITITFLLFSKQVIFTNYDSIQLLAGKLFLQRKNARRYLISKKQAFQYTTSLVFIGLLGTFVTCCPSKF